MRKLKGIILAGGTGSRLYPLTYGTSKQLLPVYDKPMIYYPLSTLLYAGIKDILIISTPKDLPRYRDLLKNGSHLGIRIKYAEQPSPNGIAEAFLIGEKFIADDNVCLILGDNIFHGDSFKSQLDKSYKNLEKGFSTIYGYEVSNPKDFGVIEIDDNNDIYKIIEKPESTKSNLIVSGLYFYTNEVIQYAKKLNPSKRGELEITDLNNIFLQHKKLKLICLDSNFSWSDTGTYDSLIKASKYFQNLEKSTGSKYACIEEIVYNLGYIEKKQFLENIEYVKNSSYGKYLQDLIK